MFATAADKHHHSLLHLPRRPASFQPLACVSTTCSVGRGLSFELGLCQFLHFVVCGAAARVCCRCRGRVEPPAHRQHLPQSRHVPLASRESRQYLMSLKDRK